MAFVSAAPNAYLADELARFIDLPSSYRGQKIKIVPVEVKKIKSNATSFPFETEKEVGEWMESAVGEWWDDETV